MNRPALFAALLTAVLWGMTGIFVYLLPHVSPFYISGGRLLVGMLFVIPSLVFMPTARQQLRRALRVPMAYVFAALLTGYYLCATSGFRFAPVAEVTLLLSLAPLFVLGLRRLRGDRPSRLEIGGALIAICGLAVILSPRLLAGAAPASATDNHLYGDLLAMGAAACTALYAHYYACLNRQLKAPPPLGTTLLTLVLGSVALLGIAALVAAPLPASLASDHHAWWMLLGLGVLSTGIPSLSFAIASQRLPPVVSSTVSLLIPVFSAIFAALFLDQGLTLPLLTGGMVLLGGVALILRGSSRA